MALYLSPRILASVTTLESLIKSSDLGPMFSMDLSYSFFPRSRARPPPICGGPYFIIHIHLGNINL